MFERKEESSFSVTLLSGDAFDTFLTLVQDSSLAHNHVALWLGRAYQQDAGSRLLLQHVRFPDTFALHALSVHAVVKPVVEMSVPFLVFLCHSPSSSQ